MSGVISMFGPYALKTSFLWVDIECSFKTQLLPTSSSSLQVNRSHGVMQWNPLYSVSVVLYIGRACEISKVPEKDLFFCAFNVCLILHIFICRSCHFYCGCVDGKGHWNLNPPKCTSLAWGWCHEWVDFHFAVRKSINHATEWCAFVMVFL